MTKGRQGTRPIPDAPHLDRAPAPPHVKGHIDNPVDWSLPQEVGVCSLESVEMPASTTTCSLAFHMSINTSVSAITTTSLDYCRQSSLPAAHHSRRHHDQYDADPTGHQRPGTFGVGGQAEGKQL